MRNLFSSLAVFLYFLKQAKLNAQDNGTVSVIVNVRNTADQEDSFSTDMDFSWQIYASLEDEPMEDEFQRQNCLVNHN